MWIRIGKKRLGIIKDSGLPPLFSERYGYVRVWRALGLKIIWRSA